MEPGVLGGGPDSHGGAEAEGEKTDLCCRRREGVDIVRRCVYTLKLRLSQKAKQHSLRGGVPL